MALENITNFRLKSQQINESKFNTAKEVVNWMGAMQAQDFAMSKWAVGIRLPNSSDVSIQDAMNRGEILRTHLLRPTWHLVSADNISWILKLTAPQIKKSMKSRHNELELSEAVFLKTNSLIEKAVLGGNHLTREEICELLEKSNISAFKERGAHIMMRAELDGIICSGKLKEGKQTYALLSERISITETFVREEALAKLARIYFASHCPATLNDFSWWSGLSIKEARQALDMIKSDLISETIDSEIYWATNSFFNSSKDNSSVHLLPAFDEFIISYKNRNAVLSSFQLKKVLTTNGIFRPVVVMNGRGIGVWKRTLKKDRVVLEIDFFSPPTQSTLQKIEKAVIPYANFLNSEIELIHSIKS